MSRSANDGRSRQKNVVSRGRFALGALCFLLMRLSLVTTLGLVVWLLFFHLNPDKKLALWVGVSLGVLIFSALNVLANARRITCPLCRASLFMSPKKLTKPRVPTWLGSRRIPMAVSLLFFPKVLRCCYCSERVRLTRSNNKDPK
ncbi:hypothetical protein [Roseibacillus ishigakijimensis]|uniref:Uncharacterized protein n=1 Tax=Roseibacillus ishigakijimensis TaxID=454146 RepID=A0A934RUA6_9BACT|nr:hypothetical protein [Roseibacillus ishigakijimensis]MBK1834300.1 hypothetical protein [Roseibacillus ishigakijimensis]